MTGTLRKEYVGETTAVADERAVIATIATADLDRDNEVILPKGIDLRNYQRNPVVMWAHDYQDLPIGKCLWIKPSPDGRGLVAKVQFARHEFAEDVYQCYKGGFLSGFSVGLRPVDAGRPTRDEIEGNAILGKASAVVRKAELLEFSAVPIPANPEALTLVKSAAMRDILSKAVTNPTPDDPDADGDDDTDGHPEPEPEQEPEAETPPHLLIKAGHYVEWGKGMAGGCGKVLSIHKGGRVPGVPDEVEGTEDEPAARVRCYKAAEDREGKWKATEKCRGLMCRELSRIPHPLDETDDEPKEKPAAKGYDYPELPPHRTIADIERSLLSGLTTVDLDAIVSKAVRETIDRRMGVI